VILISSITGLLIKELAIKNKKYITAIKSREKKSLFKCM
jgi:hypothetical protein